jgi:phage/plasmid-associated DNA primase
MQVLPFRISIPPEEQDRHLSEKLKQELPGILNLLIKQLD